MENTHITHGHRYFRIMAFLLICIAIGGFSINGIVHREEFPALYPLLIIHIVTMVGWFVLFVIQTQLIGKGNYSLHMQLGMWSLALAVGIVVTGVLVNHVTYSKGTDLVVVAGNFGALLNFSIAYAVGYLLRKKPEVHKRAMLLAGIAIVAPAIARFVIVLQLPIPLTFVFYLMLIVSLIVFDVKTKTKRPYRISILGGLVVLVGLIGAFAFGGTEVWKNLITDMWG